MRKGYERLSFAKNYEDYRQIASLMGAIAVHHCHVEMDEETAQRWGDVMVLMQDIDDQIDTGHDTLDDVHQRLQDFNNYSDLHKSLTPNSQNTAVRERLLATATKIMALSIESASTRSINTYIRCRIEESFETARLFDDSASDAVRQQENFKSQFMPLLRSMGAAAYLLDSMTDLTDDYNEGTILLEPTKRNRAILFFRSLHYFKESLPIFKERPVLYETIKIASAYANRRLVKLRPLEKVL